MMTVVVRIMRALHAALGRRLALHQPVKANCGSYFGSPDKKPRSRKPKSGGKRADPQTAAPGHAIERKRTSWFDVEPGTIAPPKSADEEEMEAWDRAHFRNWPGHR